MHHNETNILNFNFDMIYGFSLGIYGQTIRLGVKTSGFYHSLFMCTIGKIILKII